MKTWLDEVKQAVEAGEREFGLLDAHQTIMHNLIRRCEEILAEQRERILVENRGGEAAASGWD